MSIVISLIITILYLCDLSESADLQIAQIEKVTLKSCGLKSFDSIAPNISTCFRWHKTIKEHKALINIYQGRYAKEGEFPYTVLIKHRRFWGLLSGTCTGALLNDLWVLTAAHCIKDFSVDQIRIFPGITAYVSNSNYQAVYKTIIHEKYSDDRKGMIHDIGLIKLSHEVDRKRYKANGVCLPGKSFMIKRDEMAIFSGWGFLNDDEENVYSLKAAVIKFNLLGFENQPVFRTTAIVDGAVLCSGDSGGPLVQYANGRAVLIGILAGTQTEDKRKCGDVTGMLFISIPYNLDWIKHNILNNL